MKFTLTDLNKKKSHLPLSASLIASLLLAAGPKQNVLAQEIEENSTSSDLKTLHNEYHSLLSDYQTQDETDHLFINDSEELNRIKQSLIDTIQNAGYSEVANQLQVENLTIEDLTEIFERLTSEVASTEEIENDEIEEVEDIEETEESSEKTLEEDGTIQELIVEETETLEVSETEEEVEATEVSLEETFEKAVTDHELIVEEVETLEVSEPEEVELEEVASEEIVQEISNETNEVHSEESEIVTETLEVTTPEPEAANAMATSAQVMSRTATTAEEKTVIHTVKSGETLNAIGRRYGVSADHIAAINNLANKNVIRVNQQLLIKGSPEDLSQLNRPLTNAEFINVIGEHAREVAASNNLYASVMVAQAALESGFGKSTLSSAPNHNLFGIKGSYNGDSVTMQTKEYYNSTGWITIYDKFRKYPSFRESLLDNAYILRNGTSWDSTFYAGTWLENAKTFQDATSWLQGRYATDPTYAAKLNNLIAAYDLTRFDSPYQLVEEIVEEMEKDVKPSTSTQKPAESNPSENTNTTTYTVKSGDTLSRIARIYNTTVSELKALNNLRSELILIGQKLKVNKAEEVSNETSVTPTPTPSTPAPSSNEAYTVKSGDTLTHIATRYGMKVSELKSLNNLRSDLIIVGQTLKVKEKSSIPTPTPPAPTNPTTPSSTTSSATYTVKSGDTLSAISRQYNTSVSALKALNNLKSDLIFVGQTLKVNGQSSTSAPKPTTPSSTSTSGATYTVKNGDTLSGISIRYNTTVSELKRLNNLTSDLIFVNQNLVVNAGTKSVTSSSNSADTSASNSSSTSSTANTHIVKAGETLSGIATRYNISVSTIVSLNKLANANLIHVNQRLVVGQATSSSTQASSTNTANTQNNSNTHRVVAGDTLYDLALKNKTSVSAIKAKNNLNTDLIFVGQTLKI